MSLISTQAASPGRTFRHRQSERCQPRTRQLRLSPCRAAQGSSPQPQLALLAPCLRVVSIMRAPAKVCPAAVRLLRIGRRGIVPLTVVGAAGGLA